jgi:hypothetical protein
MAGLPLVGDEFAGYRVRAVLGRGGMSVVYQAENLRLSSVIALKVLAPELASDDVFRARFLEESRIAASLNHPNVIPIYDMGSQDDLLYIAMRYVSGTDMRQMIKKRGRILPAPGISGAIFQTYPNQKALYTAYMAEVSSLNSGQFRQNFADCEPRSTYGEIGWNHLFHHTRNYTVDQMIMGMVTDDQAAGRVFCNFTQGLEYMVWTNNDSHLMGYVAGPVHGDVWNWWVKVHHDLSLGGAMNMLMPTPSASGGGTSPAMSPSPSMSGMSSTSRP